MLYMYFFIQDTVSLGLSMFRLCLFLSFSYLKVLCLRAKKFLLSAGGSGVLADGGWCVLCCRPVAAGS